MKTAGIVRKVDELGRIVLPAEMRRLLELDRSDVEIYLDGNRICLRKYSPNCIFCGAQEALTQLAGKSACTSCIQNLQEGK